VKGRLVKLSVNLNALRTDEVVGDFLYPKVGERFVMLSDALEPGFGCRIINTSPVTKVHDETGDYVEFSTLNSLYGLYILENE